MKTKNKIGGVCLLLLLKAVTLGVTTTWIGSSGNWKEYSNWDNGVPTVSDDAVIQTNVVATINGTVETVNSIELSGSTPTITVLGGGSLTAAIAAFDSVNSKAISLDSGSFEYSDTAAHNYKDIEITLANGAAFTTNGWVRCLSSGGSGVKITIDNSTFTGKTLQPFSADGLVDVTVQNGGSFSLTQANFGWYNNAKTSNLTINGAGNTISLSFIKDGGTANYTFVADSSGISEIDVTGSILLSAGTQTLTINLTAYSAAAGQSFTLFDGAGAAASGTFESVTITGWTQDHEIDYTGGADGTDIVLTLIEVVPEATQPSPVDGSTVYDTAASLGWNPGSFADSHNVYFGTDFDGVNDASPAFLAGDRNLDSIVDINDLQLLSLQWLSDIGSADLTGDNSLNIEDFSLLAANWLGISIYKGNRIEETYIPSEPRTPGQVYYWRIDEVNGNNIWKGDVWSFEQSFVPQTVAELFSGFDPRADDLELEVVSDYISGSLRRKVVRYLINTWKGQKSYMTAYYACPEGQTDLPAVLHLHGGGQRSSWSEVEYYANRGYAAMSINWGGKSLPDVDDASNTNWGAIDPTQDFASRYQNLMPYPETIDTVESPRNCSWYPIIIASRKALTFLEQQPEVGSNKLGLYGHSMGGQLTTYVCGSGENRLKVAAPSVGGAGFRMFDDYELPGTKRTVNGDLNLYSATMETQSYAPYIQTPILFLGATNDFNAKMDRVHQTYALIPSAVDRRLTFTPHMNHRFTDTHYICRALWIDQHLKGTFTFPEKPLTTVSLSEPDGIPLLMVTPDSSYPIVAVDLYYSHDQDIDARFWRDVNEGGGVSTDGAIWWGQCPIMDTTWYRSTSIDANEYLFAFANVTYEVDGTQFAISSDLHVFDTNALIAAGVPATDTPSTLIDDFARDYHDWYLINEGHASLTQFWTRKITDPKWHGSLEQKLKIRVLTPSANQFKITLIENEWRNRGPKMTYETTVSVGGDPACRDIVLDLSDFTGLTQWDEIDRVGISPISSWNLPTPVLCELSWISN